MHSPAIAQVAGVVSAVCELGSGSGRKTRFILDALRSQNGNLVYSPIDVSSAALANCTREVSDLATVRPVCADWMDGLQQLSRQRSEDPLLLLFLGSSIGNLSRIDLPQFLSRIAAALRPDDLFLLGVDLVKDVETMLTAYDDPTGVTAAFNLNLLGRINRELNADFDLRSFAHEVRWNSEERRIEMHLLSGRQQTVSIAELESTFDFEAGETIWTEASNKFVPAELVQLATASGFATLNAWTDQSWPFSEVLWKVR
jgi:dimethylhistidine N-methyltransferase